MKEFQLIVGRRLPFTPNVVDRITIDETQSRVNELMGVSDMDFIQMNSKRAPDESVEGIDESIVQVAKLMGVSLKDIRKYGYKEPSSELEMDRIGEEGQDIDDAVLRVASQMGIDSEDIKKYGHKELSSES